MGSVLLPEPAYSSVYPRILVLSWYFNSVTITGESKILSRKRMKEALYKSVPIRPAPLSYRAPRMLHMQEQTELISTETVARHTVCIYVPRLSSLMYNNLQSPRLNNNVHKGALGFFKRGRLPQRMFRPIAFVLYLYCNHWGLFQLWLCRIFCGRSSGTRVM